MIQALVAVDNCRAPRPVSVRCAGMSVVRFTLESTMNSPIGIHVHRTTRIEVAATVLASTLTDGLTDPFEAPQVCVPHASMKRWLTQFLAVNTPGGICAGVAITTVTQWRRQLFADHAVFVDDSWAPAQQAWTIMDVAATSTDPELACVRQHLADPSGRYGKAFRIASLFDRYQQCRPALLQAWTDGDNAGIGQLDQWQPVLWRALQHTIRVPDPLASRRLLLDAIVNAPPANRITFFAPQGLSPADLDLLVALSRGAPVDVWLVATPERREIADNLRTFAAAKTRWWTRPSRSAVMVPSSGNRLLESLGQQERETELLLRNVAASWQDDADDVSAAPPPSADDSNTLHDLQQALRSDSVPPGLRLNPGTGPHGLSIHASHDLSRQVEVLRESLTGLFADDPTLEPRDVLIVCANPEAAAPLLEAAFSANLEHSHPAGRLRLHAHSTTGGNPLADVIERLLVLRQTRATQADLLALCENSFIASKFGFRRDDIAALRNDLANAGVRWGLDVSHRDSAGLGFVHTGTWLTGVAQLLAGVAYEEILPDLTPAVHQVTSSDLSRLGALAEFVTRIAWFSQECSRPATVRIWTDRLRWALDNLVAVSGEQTWQQTRLDSVLAEMGQAATSGQVSAQDFTAALQHQLRLLQTRPSIGTGNLVVTGLHDARQVPFRVICLLGPDEPDFPKSTPRTGDDLTWSDPQVGDGHVGLADRQALLDAIMAARDSLVVVYAARNPMTNAAVWPSAPLADFLDAATRCAGADVIRQHRLQPFDPREFTHPLSSFDEAMAHVARVSLQPRPSAPPVYTWDRLPALPPAPITVDDLVSFFAHPASYLLRLRGGLRLLAEEPVPDELPVALDGLARWQIGDRLLGLVERGRSLDQAVAQELHRGSVAPGEIGRRLVETTAIEVQDVLQAVQRFDGAAQWHPIALNVGDHTVTGVITTRGDTILTRSYSRISAKSKFSAWVRLLILAVASPDQKWRSVCVHRGQRRPWIISCPTDPERRLAFLLDLYRDGCCEPLPIPLRTGLTYAERRDRVEAVTRLRHESLTSTWARERDAAWDAFFPDDSLFTREAPQWGPADEPTWFGAAALRMWTPLRAAEVS